MKVKPPACKISLHNLPDGFCLNHGFDLLPRRVVLLSLDMAVWITEDLSDAACITLNVNTTLGDILTLTCEAICARVVP